jgi:hypothetical protein
VGNRECFGDSFISDRSTSSIRKKACENPIIKKKKKGFSHIKRRMKLLETQLKEFFYNLIKKKEKTTSHMLRDARHLEIGLEEFSYDPICKKFSSIQIIIIKKSNNLSVVKKVL